MEPEVGARPTAPTLGPFTGRQLTTIICVLAVLVLFPIGAWAISGSQVFVTDPHTGAHAAVNNGQLSVMGPTAAPPGTAYTATALFVEAGACAPLTSPVPAGSALVVTQITVDVNTMSTGPLNVSAQSASAGSPCVPHGTAGTAELPGKHTTAVMSFPAGYPIRAGRFVSVTSTGGSGDALGLISVHGFLVPSSECTVLAVDPTGFGSNTAASRGCH
jgi:hypothetical protein